MKKFREPFAVFCEEIYCEENILFFNEVVELEEKQKKMNGEFMIVIIIIRIIIIIIIIIISE